MISIQITKYLTICKLLGLEKKNDLPKVFLDLDRTNWNLSSRNFCAPLSEPRQFISDSSLYLMKSQCLSWK